MSKERSGRRGGRREGAGRKPGTSSPRKRGDRTLSLPNSLWDFLDEKATEKNLSRSTFVEQMLKYCFNNGIETTMNDSTLLMHKYSTDVRTVPQWRECYEWVAQGMNDSRVPGERKVKGAELFDDALDAGEFLEVVKDGNKYREIG